MGGELELFFGEEGRYGLGLGSRGGTVRRTGVGVGVGVGLEEVGTGGKAIGLESCSVVDVGERATRRGSPW